MDKKAVEEKAMDREIAGQNPDKRHDSIDAMGTQTAIAGENKENGHVLALKRNQNSCMKMYKNTFQTKSSKRDP